MQLKCGAETTITTVDWLWKPFIPFGKVTIIQGDGGEGKTTLILKIAAMLTQGYLPPTMHEGHLDEPQKAEPMTVLNIPVWRSHDIQPIRATLFRKTEPSFPIRRATAQQIERWLFIFYLVSLTLEYSSLSDFP